MTVRSVYFANADWKVSCLSLRTRDVTGNSGELDTARSRRSTNYLMNHPYLAGVISFPSKMAKDLWNISENTKVFKFLLQLHVYWKVHSQRFGSYLCKLHICTEIGSEWAVTSQIMRVLLVHTLFRLRFKVITDKLSTLSRWKWKRPSGVKLHTYVTVNIKGQTS